MRLRHAGRGNHPPRLSSTGRKRIGLERFARGSEPIKVVAYEGGRFPFGDGSFDLVLVADVLHHEVDEAHLLRECARVCRRLVIIKDHAREGPLAQARISLMDWAANAPYGVKCLYRYHTITEWKELIERCGLEQVNLMHPLRIYPRLWERLFGGRLQCLAVTKPRATPSRG